MADEEQVQLVQPNPVPTTYRSMAISSPEWQGVMMEFFTATGHFVVFLPPDHAKKFAGGVNDMAIEAEGAPVIYRPTHADVIKIKGNGHSERG